jgi:hypothetical protein
MYWLSAVEAGPASGRRRSTSGVSPMPANRWRRALPAGGRGAAAACAAVAPARLQPCRMVHRRLPHARMCDLPVAYSAGIHHTNVLPQLLQQRVFGVIVELVVRVGDQCRVNFTPVAVSHLDDCGFDQCRYRVGVTGHGSIPGGRRPARYPRRPGARLSTACLQPSRSTARWVLAQCARYGSWPWLRNSRSRTRWDSQGRRH